MLVLELTARNAPTHIRTIPFQRIIAHPFLCFSPSSQCHNFVIWYLEMYSVTSKNIKTGIREEKNTNLCNTVISVIKWFRKKTAAKAVFIFYVVFCVRQYDLKRITKLASEEEKKLNLCSTVIPVKKWLRKKWLGKQFLSSTVCRILCPQCGGGADRCLHRHRLDAGADEAREDGGRVRSRDLPARPAQLHGPDGGPVHLHPWRPAGGRPLGQHWGQLILYCNLLIFCCGSASPWCGSRFWFFFMRIQVTKNDADPDPQHYSITFGFFFFSRSKRRYNKGWSFKLYLSKVGWCSAMRNLIQLLIY